MTIHIHDSLDGSQAASGGRRAARLTLVGLVGAATVATLVGAMGGTASAQTGDTSPGSTQGNVAVTTSIALTGLTPSFTLTGIPGATVTGDQAVSMNVETNNLAGYAVTVESTLAALAANTSGNVDSIPIDALSVRESGTTPFTALGGTVTVHSQNTRSASGGDSISNDYQIVIPFVNEDTYTTTLDYIATTK
jgi:hypothetical protein